MIVLHWGDSHLTVSGLPDALENKLYYVEKEFDNAQKKIIRERVPIFHVVQEGSKTTPRIIVLAQGFLDRVVGLIKHAGLRYTLTDARMPFPQPKLNLMHGFRFSQQRLTIQLLMAGRSACLRAPTRYGKCFGRGTLVRMYDGSLCEIQDIYVGMKVMRPDGSPAVVVARNSGTEELVSLRFSNGYIYNVTLDHPFQMSDGSIMEVNEIISRIDSGDKCFVRRIRSDAVDAENKSAHEELHDLVEKFLDCEESRTEHKKLLTEIQIKAWRCMTWKLLSKILMPLMTIHNGKLIGIRVTGQNRGGKMIWRLVNALGSPLGVCAFCSKFHDEEFVKIKGASRFGDIGQTEMLDNSEIDKGYEVVSYKKIGENIYYGIEIDSEDQLFVLGDGSVSHNTTIITNILRAYPDLRSVVAIPGTDLVRQAYLDLKEKLPDRELAWFGTGSKFKFQSDHVTICSMDSLHKCDAESIRLLICDEPHAALTDERFIQFERFVNARRFAIGATLGGRFDNRDILLEGLFGPVVSDITFREAVAEGAICDIQVFMLDLDLTFEDCVGTYKYARDHAMRKHLLKSERISSLYRALVDKVIPPDWQTITFIKSEDQAMFLKDTAQSETFLAMDKVLTKSERTKLFDDMVENKVKRCLATNIYSQGVTFPHLRCLINLAGGGPYQTAVQKPGRLAQVQPGKKCGVLFDINFRLHPELWQGMNSARAAEVEAKDGIGALINDSRRRLEVYKNTGYKITHVGTLQELKQEFAKCV